MRSSVVYGAVSAARCVDCHVVSDEGGLCRACSVESAIDAGAHGDLRAFRALLRELREERCTVHEGCAVAEGGGGS